MTMYKMSESECQGFCSHIKLSQMCLSGQLTVSLFMGLLGCALHHNLEISSVLRYACVLHHNLEIFTDEHYSEVTIDLGNLV